MKDNPTVSILVTTDEEGFALYRVRGPYFSTIMARHRFKYGSNKLAWATANALHGIPYNLFARRIHGQIYADKKLPVLLKSCDDDFLKQMERLEDIQEGSPEWDTLKSIRHKFEFKLKKVSDRDAAMENLKAFHKYQRPLIG